MRDLGFIALFAAAVLLAAFTVESGATMTFLLLALYGSLLAQSWNILGGFGGQFSFGHAMFFGVGAYLQVIAQLSWGFNPWLALPLAVLGAALLGVFVGRICFRYGLKGSYFALVTLAFAEILRVLATSVDFTGGGVGLMLPLNESLSNMQFGSRRGYVLLMLGFVVAALLVSSWLRHSRPGAYLQAVRDNEDAARAVGVTPSRIKLMAMTLSAAFMGSAGALYVQIFQYVDPGIAFGPAVSVEALVAAVVGGLGTVWGPVLGAVALHVLGDLTRNLIGQVPGVNMVIYGLVLILIILLVPRGMAGLAGQWRRRARRGASHD